MTNPSKYFQVQELVPSTIYNIWGERSLQFIDERLIILLDFTREFFNKPLIINNWHLKGSYNESCFRMPDTAVGGKLSQHKFGRAADIKIPGLTSRQIYDEILNHEKIFMAAGLTTMENIDATPTWVHIDIRYQGEAEKIIIVNP